MNNKKSALLNAFLTCNIIALYKMLRKVKKTDMNEIYALGKMLERSDSYYKLTYEWIHKKNSGKSILDYFVNNNLNKIAIYGNGSLGELFFEEIKHTNIEIVCFVDQASTEIFQTEQAIPVMNIQEFSNMQTEVDAIVLTPIHVYDEIIKDFAARKLDYQIISLEEIIYNY
jgi:FlaA1/EpsC-like NDP-sugar epimerase